MHPRRVVPLLNNRVVPSAALYPVISSVVATVTGSDVTITWTTDIATQDNGVEYGLTTAYGSSQGDQVHLTTSHSIDLLGLADGVYHYRVWSAVAVGGAAVTYSADGTFTVNATKSEMIFGLLPVYVNQTTERQSAAGATYLNENI